MVVIEHTLSGEKNLKNLEIVIIKKVCFKIPKIKISIIPIGTESKN